MQGEDGASESLEKKAFGTAKYAQYAKKECVAKNDVFLNG
jgi:hypothetical protein